jgi:hypothetical protein
MTAYHMKKLVILIVSLLGSIQIYASNPESITPAPGTLSNGEPSGMQGSNNGMQPPTQGGNNGMQAPMQGGNNNGVQPPPPQGGRQGLRPPPQGGENGMRPPPPQGNNNGMQPPPPPQSGNNGMQPPPSSPQNVSHQIPNGAHTQPLQSPGNNNIGNSRAEHQNGPNGAGSSDSNIAPDNNSN